MNLSERLTKAEQKIEQDLKNDPQPKKWGSLTPDKPNQELVTRVISDGPDDTVLQAKQFTFLSTVSFVPNAPANFEWPVGVSETVPDMEMSIQQIFDKFASGGTVVGFSGQYYEDEFPNWDDLDLVEKQELLEDTKAQVKQMEEAILKAQKEADDEAKIKAFEDQQKAETPPKNEPSGEAQQ